MYGYIVVNQGEMKFREYDVYHSYYCGLCKSLKKQYGWDSQLTLTYDMTFVVMLLSGLYEPETSVAQENCMIHPFKKHMVRSNCFSEYAADMNMLLFYEKCRDDWNDERKVTRRMLMGMLKSSRKKVAAKYPEKTRRIMKGLKGICLAEKNMEPDIDKVSGYYGDVMGEVLACRADVWEETLRRMGFFLGKYVYLLDAFEDVEKDSENAAYNPLRKHYEEHPESFEDECKKLLTMMMTECCREFEKLPIIENVEILRNVLYAGVWSRFYQVADRRRKQQEKRHE